MNMPETSLARRVRAFFGNHGVCARHALDDNCDELLSLLERRQQDPSFWAPLTDLLREITKSAISSGESGWLAFPQAKLLATWDADELALRLREALATCGCSERGRTRWARFSSGLSPAALTAFLLLGFAATACSENVETANTGAGGAAGSAGSAGAQTGGAAGSTGGAGGVAESGADAAGAAGSAAGAAGTGGGTFVMPEGGGDTQIPAPDVAVEAEAGADSASADADAWDAAENCYSQIFRTVQASKLTPAQKEAVYLCIINLKTSWCDGLANLFATSTTERTAAVLEDILMCCQAAPSTLKGEYTPAVQQQLLSGMVCAVPLYRGVSFPD